MSEKEVEHQGLEDEAYRLIREALINGAFAPLERLSIRAVSAKLSLSPMPVRAALRRLISERSLDATPSGTAYVPRLSREEFDILTQMRLALEPMALRQAAPKLRPEDYRRLAHWLSLHEAALSKGDPDAARDADTGFLFTLYHAAGVEMLAQVIESLWLRRSPMFWEARWALMTASLSKAPHRHEAILAALKAGDIERACAALHQEISQTAEFLAGAMKFRD